MLEEYGINVVSGTTRFGGNNALYLKYLKKFPQEDSFNKLEQALEAQDVDAAYLAAHTIKGVAGNLSVDSVYEASLPINDALKSGDIVKANQLYPNFRQLYERACKGIKQYFNE